MFVPLSQLAAKAGVLGIRAKHIEWQPLVGPAEPPWLRSTVQEIDDTGDDTLIYADLAGEPVRVLETRGRKVAVGDTIALHFPDQSVHLFTDGQRADIEVGS